MSFSEDLFWGDVAGDHERDLRTAALTHGKVAVAAYWPFLAAAYSEQDFENRLSLSLSRISTLVAPELLDEVVSSLRDDYRLVTTAEKGGKPWESSSDDDDDKKKELKDESDKDKAQAEDETGSDNDSDDDDDAKGEKEGESESDDDDDDDSKGNQPNFLNKKQRDQSHTDKSDKAKKESKTAAEFSPTHEHNFGGNRHLEKDLNEGEAEQRYMDDAANDRDEQSWLDKEGFLHTALGKFGPEHIDAYRAWAKKNGHNDDELSTLRSYEKTPGVGRAQADHIADEYHGEDTSWREKERYQRTGAYVPDPSNAGRYQYQNLESLPLNNGDLQGPDGWVEDLAEGEQRTPEAYARQTTPGTWEQGSGMPERPMPQGVERGYHPVAAKDRFDKEGFLVESLVDPQLGAPINANPYYFSDGSQGLAGDSTFPTDPWGGNVPDRANEYGDVQPGASAGSEEGTSDGKGYSRSHPGETVASKQSPNFNRVGREESLAERAIREKANDLGSKHEWDYGHYPEEGDDAPRDESLYPTSHTGSADGKTFRLNCTVPGCGKHFFSQTPTSKSFSDHVESHRDENEWSYDPHDGFPYPPMNHGSSWKKGSVTDGKIVGNCPGCEKPLRKHTNGFRDEFHHLHNDHVRCHGAKTAGGHNFAEDTDRLVSRAPRHTAEPFPSGAVVHINGYPDSAYHTVVGNSPNAAHVSPYGREDSGTKFTVPHDRITRVAFIPNGGNLGGHDAPLSFLEALGYMDGYSIANNSQAQFATTAADYLGRPDAFNPTGRGPDEYKARTWDSYQTTRPMQSHEDRNVNTPVLPAEPLRTRNIGPESGSQFDRSKTDRLDQSGDDQDED